MIYVLETRDKDSDWHPMRVLDTVIAFTEQKYAERRIKERRAFARSRAAGASALRYRKTRYRVVKYGVLDVQDDQEKLFVEGEPMIFVFGSNEAGIHGGGAARVALDRHGAVFGRSFGMQGRSFAIPTKGTEMVRGKLTVGSSLRIEKVESYVYQFIEYAKNNPQTKFQVTQIGCGLAGFTPEQIAPLFKDAPDNCLFDDAWKPFLPGKNFWGTF
jgi:hypothetical protein